MQINESWTWGEDPGNCEHPEPYQYEEVLTADRKTMVQNWRCPTCGVIKRSAETPI